MTPPLSRAEKAPSEVQILSPCHSANLDRNANNYQRTSTNIHKHEAALEATGGMSKNTSERCSSYFFLGTISLIACHMYKSWSRYQLFSSHLLAQCVQKRYTLAYIG